MDHNRTRQHRRGICSCRRLVEMFSQPARSKRMARMLKSDPELFDSIQQAELQIKTKE